MHHIQMPKFLFLLRGQLAMFCRKFFYCFIHSSPVGFLKLDKNNPIYERMCILQHTNKKFSSRYACIATYVRMYTI